MGKSFEKWLTRACRYEEILNEEGLRSSREYMMRFEKKLPKLLEALWEVYVEDLEELEEHLLYSGESGGQTPHPNEEVQSL